MFIPAAAHLLPEQEKTRYLKHRNSIEDEGYAEMLRRPIRLLQEHAPDVRTVLDYGSGPEPTMVTLLRRAGYQATGYDPCFGSSGSSGHDVSADCGRRLEAPILQTLEADDSARFDAIVSVETFEHFAEPNRELDRILAHLDPNGYLLIQTLFHRGTESFSDWWYARDPTHIAFYSHATMAWIARTWGMSILHLGEKNLTLLRRRGG